MKHFLFVSVAVGFFSGTSLKLKAQPSVNFIRSELKNPSKNNLRLAEGIEVNVGTISLEEDVILPGTGDDYIRPSASAVINKPVTATNNSIENCSLLQFKYALLTNREVEELSNLDLYSFIDEWWATRYRYGGTTKNGIDCSAYTGTLLSSVYGFEVPRTARAQYGICEKIDTEDLMEGDLVFFNTRGGVSHVGVYLGNGYFTHSSCSNGVTINNLNENYYSKRFIGGGRINQ